MYNLISKTSVLLLSVHITVQPNKVKILIAVISESSDHSQIAAFTCSNAIVNELKKQMKNSLKKVILCTDGCSSQFCFKCMFASMTHFVKSVQLEVHHEKSPMDSVDWTIKRVVFGLVESNKIAIKTAEEFATEPSKAPINLPFLRWWDNRTRVCQSHSIHSENSWYSLCVMFF